MTARAANTFQYAGGRSIYRNGQPFVYLNRSEQGAYVIPTEVDTFAAAIPDMVKLLQEAADRLERLDARLLEATGSAKDSDLGEVTRIRALLARIG